MDIFNTKILNNRQRWNRALLYGIGASVISILVCSLVQRYLIETSLLYLAAAYFISWVILEAGHGVQTKFSILAVVCTGITILFSEILSVFGLVALLNPIAALLFIIQSFLIVDLNNLIRLALCAYSIYLSYERARVV